MGRRRRPTKKRGKRERKDKDKKTNSKSKAKKTGDAAGVVDLFVNEFMVVVLEYQKDRPK